MILNTRQEISFLLNGPTSLYYFHKLLCKRSTITGERHKHNCVNKYTHVICKTIVWYVNTGLEQIVIVINLMGIKQNICNVHILLSKVNINVE